MASVYFDSSVFIAILAGEESAKDVKLLLRELKRTKIRVITSIITIQEVSVTSYKKGTPAKDHHAAVNKLARIEGIDRDIALTAAKFEAQILDAGKKPTKSEIETDNKRRKWDCFHMATAVVKGCDALYSMDDGMLKRKEQFAIPGIAFLYPRPKGLLLPFAESDVKSNETTTANTAPAEVRRSPDGHFEDQAGAEATKEATAEAGDSAAIGES